MEQKNLTWGKQGEYKKTIYNSRILKVPTFYTSPSTNKKEDEHVVFAYEEIKEEHPPLAEENDDAVKHNDDNIFSLLPNKEINKEIDVIADDTTKFEASTPKAEFMR